MADNTTINRGTDGDTIATDDIAGVKHQKVKMEYGVDGTAAEVSATNPLPVIPDPDISSSVFLRNLRSSDELGAIKEELKKINFHLSLITGG